MLRLLRILFNALAAGLAFDPGRRQLLRCPRHRRAPPLLPGFHLHYQIQLWLACHSVPHPIYPSPPPLKTHLSVDWGGFSMEPRHVKMVQKRSKWCLYGGFLAFNGACRQCSWYLPKLPPLSRPDGCLCLEMFVCSVVDLLSLIPWLYDYVKSLKQEQSNNVFLKADSLEAGGKWIQQGTVIFCVAMLNRRADAKYWSFII